MVQKGIPFPEYVETRAVKAPGPGDIYPVIVGADGRYMTYQGLLDLILANAGGGGGGVTLEQVRDNLAVALVAGTGMVITPDDGNDTITIGLTAAPITLENVRDDLAAVLQEGAGITITVDDALNTITITATATGDGSSGNTFHLDYADALISGPPTATAFQQTWWCPDTGDTYSYVDTGDGILANGAWSHSGSTYVELPTILDGGGVV